jgi:hypothetical protein
MAAQRTKSMKKASEKAKNNIGSTSRKRHIDWRLNQSDKK